MNQRYFPVLICASLLLSGSIITGIANAYMDDTSHKRGKLMAKKLDINIDGKISREELASHQDNRFQMLGLNGDGMIDKTEFTAALPRCSRRWTAMVMAAWMIRKSTK